MATRQLPHEIRLEIDSLTVSASPMVVSASVVGMSATENRSRDDLGDSEAHAVDRDRALRHEVAQETLGRPHPQAPAVPVVIYPDDLADRVDVSLDEVPVQRIAKPQRQLEVDPCPRADLAESGSTTCLF